MIEQDHFGGGSGTGPADDTAGCAANGSYLIVANEIGLLGRPGLFPPTSNPSTISIVAAGQCMDGQVAIRGSKGVRITAGLPVGLVTESSSTDGAEICTGESGTITLHRGLLPVDQKMEFKNGAISIDGGSGKVTIESLTEITLSVAGGVSKIKLGPDGITIEGLMVQVKGSVQAQVQGAITQIKGDGMTQISGGITMIG